MLLLALNRTCLPLGGTSGPAGCLALTSPTLPLVRSCSGTPGPSPVGGVRPGGRAGVRREPWVAVAGRWQRGPTDRQEASAIEGATGAPC